MAQLNITLNQEEILQLLSENREDAFKTLLQESLNNILQAESSAQIGAEKYERSEERTDSRNGARQRLLTTRIGTIVLTVPRHREVPFHTLIFDNYSRSEAALIASMAEMVVNGVSSRKVATVMETLCGTSYSKSTVSEVCKTLDESVIKFKNRPLEYDYPFVYVDATYFKVRNEHRIISKALMIALAITNDGKREIIGFDVFDNESKETWRTFLMSLKNRGLSGLKAVISDSHEGVKYAVCNVFPNVAWQRCQTHFARNIIEHAPKKYQKALQGELIEMFNSKTIKEARQKRDSIIEEYKDVAEKSMECLDLGFEDSMTVMILPEKMRKFFRTTNYLERLNRELKRRSKVIGVFPNATSLIRLMGSVLIELNDGFSVKASMTVSRKDFIKLQESEYIKQIQEIAKEQRKLMVA